MLVAMTFRSVFIAVVIASGLVIGAFLINRARPPVETQLGNFVFSLTDHAQNGFFNRAEWIPVVSSALAIGLLIVPFISEVTSSYLWLCAGGLGLQALVGVAGFLLHARATVDRPATTLFERIIDGPPALAPLLFPNLVVLGCIALAAMWPRVPVASDPT
jgi:hypothetical protein